MELIPLALIGLMLSAIIGLSVYWGRQTLAYTDTHSRAIHAAAVAPLQQWRNDALFALAVLQVVLGTMSTLSDSIVQLQRGNYIGIGLNLVIYAVIALAGMRRDLPFMPRAIVVIGIGYLFAVHLVIAYGLVGSGRIIFISNTVCAALFFGWWGALTHWLLLLVTVLGFYWAIDTGAYVQPAWLAERVFAPVAWLNNGAVVLQISGLLAGLVVWLGRRLVQSIAATETAHAQLAQANATLEQRVAERTAELHQSLQTLREREHFIQRVTQATPDLIYVYDLHKQSNVYSNRASDTMLGYTPGQLQGLGAQLGAIVIPPDSLDKLVQHHANVAAAADREAVELEYPVLHNDGSRRWLLSRDVVFVRDDEGRATQILGIAQDITQRKQVELTLQQTNASLARRVDEVLALNRMAQALTRWTDLCDALTSVQSTVARLFAAVDVSVWQLENSRSLVRLSAHDESVVTQVAIDDPLTQRVIGAQQTLVLAPHEPMPRVLMHTAEGGGALLVPLLARTSTIGLLAIRAAQTDRMYAPNDVALAQTIASVLAGAVENARLFAQAQQLAAQEERQRLARDLHDSVSQALFAASVSADVVPQLWELDPDEGREMLGEVSSLTRGALAEMRTLLVELRPTQLLHTPLGDLMRHLVTAAGTRSRVPATAMTTALPALSPEVRVALYRIAQEALSNIVKHAQPNSIAVRLEATPPVLHEGAAPWAGTIQLEIGDDGRGFVVNTSAAHYGIGLSSMAERAAAIRAQFSVDSAPGKGTCIRVVWSGTAVCQEETNE